VNRGEIYRVARPRDDPKRFRAFVVVSRQVLLDSAFATAVCAPIFTGHHGLATQVDVGEAEGLKHSSSIYCDNLVSIAKADLTNFIGTLSPAKLVELNRALRVALDLA
jgi:mRNA interferase MazF